ncbi:MAG: site-2 protease family protein [Microcoleaceae cyanobacterium]|jgi:Zn-dependent protease/CBS domain-containing protein
MQAGWRIGSLFGIPLFLDTSWFIILALATLGYAQDYQALGNWQSWLAGFIMALLLFSSVLLHELGHSLVAISQGIKVNSITLFLFGGVASIEQESKTPGQAFQVAIAGPLVSLGLFFILGLIAQMFPPDSLLNKSGEQLALINGILAGFNLIPGLPLDGGQVLKAAVWKLTGSRFAGVRWASKVGQILGWLAIAYGISKVLVGGYDGIWIGLIGLFALRNAAAYSRLTDLQEALIKTTAFETMTREFRVINADLTLRQFADQYVIEMTHFPVYVAASQGRDRGLVNIDDIRYIERSLWEEKTVHDIVHPLSERMTVSEKMLLLEVINLMETNELPRIIVVSPTGSVSGVIDRGDIVKAVGKFLKVDFPDAEIKRIKEEGVYPAGFQLGAIAKVTQP